MCNVQAWVNDVEHGVNSVTDAVSHTIGTDGANEGVLQGSLQGASDTVTSTGKDVAGSPLAQAVITAAAAAYGVPPAVTAALLGINRTAQDGDITAGLLDGISSYMGGNAVNSYLSGEQLAQLAKYGLTTALRSGAQGGGSDGATTTATTPAPDGGALDDIFSHFTGGTSGFTMPALPDYDADPSGMIAAGKQFRDYHTSEYEPYARKLRQEVDRMGSPEYLAQQRGLAMAGVQQQYDNTMRQSARDMARMGVTPDSGRAMALRQQGAVQNAAAKVNAAAQAEGLVRKDYLGGLGAVHTAGMDVSKAGQQWAALGNDATKNKMGWNLGAGELGLKGFSANQNAAQGWGKLALDKYGFDKGAINASQLHAQDNQAKVDAQANSDRTTLLAAVGKSLFDSMTSGDSKSFWD